MLAGFFSPQIVTVTNGFYCGLAHMSFTLDCNFNLETVAC